MTEQGRDLGELLWAPIRTRWPMILGLGLLAVLATLAWQATSTPKYTARVVVFATNQESGGLAGQLGSLGSVAALAGASLGRTKQVSEFDKFEFLLTSARLGDYQAREREILPIVFWRRWDGEKGAWKRPEGPVQTVKDLLWPVFGLPAWLPPDGRDLAEEYDRRLTTRSKGETGLFQLAYVDSDPDRAVRILKAIVEDANELARRDAAARSAAKAEYLREQLQKAQVAEYRTNLAMLLAVEEQTLMLTSTNLPYAAEIVQPFTVSRKPTSQRPVVFGLIAAIVGLSFGLLLALALGPKRSPAESASGND